MQRLDSDIDRLDEEARAIFWTLNAVQTASLRTRADELLHKLSSKPRASSDFEDRPSRPGLIPTEDTLTVRLDLRCARETVHAGIGRYFYFLSLVHKSSAYSVEIPGLQDLRE